MKKSTANQWSETIHLPRTEFPMRAELAKRELLIIDFWKRHKPYQKLLQDRENQDQKFILHDGPPYANGRFHVGHALNKILKDMINKYHLLSGAYVNYVPGWDCHGLPIELAVMKRLNNKKDGLVRNPSKIRKACREYALDYIKQQSQDQTRMGVFWNDLGVDKLTTEGNVELSNIYYTMSQSFESAVLEVFRDLFCKGLIYKGKKPIYWCSSCRTALAEAEIEYAEHTSPSIYVKFPVKNKPNTHLAIWTTTPWTIPANLGVSFHPDFEYAAYDTEKGNLIIAKGLEERFFEITKFTHKKSTRLSSEEIQNLEVMHPFINRKSKILLGEHVTLEAGTGIVHTAPGHGRDDYIIGQKYGLEILSPVDHKGCYTHEFPEMEGVKVFEANKKIIEKLQDTETLIHQENFQHNYPHCWRCRKPLIFRATPQWFLSCAPLQEKAAEEVKKVKWTPDWGENRFQTVIANRPDWCLSRQRFWGVPIPSFVCSGCGKSYLTEASLNHVVEKVQKKGIEIWFEEEVHSLLPRGAICDVCGGAEFAKEHDILDVWFDSGVTWKAVLKGYKNLNFPADLYLEGSDQHRGWFQSSLWPSLALEDKAPYREALTHGYVLDENGRAMSKSIGNVISPSEDIIPKYGADVLRLWVASEDYRTDNAIGPKIIDQIADSYRKIRNTFRYLLGNLGNLQGEQQDANQMKKVIYDELDLWILHKLELLGQEMKDSYRNYEFHNVYQKALLFCTIDLSQTYFDIIRDSLYCDANPQQSNMWNEQKVLDESVSDACTATLTDKTQTESLKRRESALATLRILLRYLNIWLAPILSFTMEEVYQLMNSQREVSQSVFEEPWPISFNWSNPSLEKKFSLIWILKDKVNEKLEDARSQKVIGSSIEAVVYILPNLLTIEISEQQLAKYLVVSEVVVSDVPNVAHEKKRYAKDGILVQASKQARCPRCWSHRALIENDLCNRCHSVLAT